MFAVAGQRLAGETKDSLAPVAGKVLLVDGELLLLDLLFQIAFALRAGSNVRDVVVMAVDNRALSAATVSVFAFVNSTDRGASFSAKAEFVLRSSTLKPSNSGLDRIQRMRPVRLSRHTKSDTSAVRKILSPTTMGIPTPMFGIGAIHTMPLVA